MLWLTVSINQLYRELKREWIPQGAQEHETVLPLARANWMKHRLMRSTGIATRRDPFFAEAKKPGRRLGEKFRR